MNIYPVDRWASEFQPLYVNKLLIGWLTDWSNASIDNEPLYTRPPTTWFYSFSMRSLVTVDKVDNDDDKLSSTLTNEHIASDKYDDMPFEYLIDSSITLDKESTYPDS